MYALLLKCSCTSSALFVRLISLLWIYLPWSSWVKFWITFSYCFVSCNEDLLSFLFNNSFKSQLLPFCLPSLLNFFTWGFPFTILSMRICLPGEVAEELIWLLKFGPNLWVTTYLSGLFLLLISTLCVKFFLLTLVADASPLLFNRAEPLKVDIPT